MAYDPNSSPETKTTAVATLPVATPPAVVPAAASTKAAVVPPRATSTEPAATTESISKENVELARIKRSAFDGVVLNDDVKTTLTNIGKTVGLTLQKTENNVKDASAAAELKDVKDFNYMVLGARILDRANALTADVARIQAAGVTPNPEQSATLRQFEQLNKQLESSPAMDTFLETMARVNSRSHGRLA